MDKTELLILTKMRHKAQMSNEPVHVYPTAEEAVHTLAISEDTIKANVECAKSRAGQMCFCEPAVEDYTPDGGGVLVIHKQVVWQ